MEVFFSAGMGKGNKYSQDQSRIMLLFEHNFRHNDVILRVTIKSKMLKFSGIMYLTLSQAHHSFNCAFLCRHYTTTT